MVEVAPRLPDGLVAVVKRDCATCCLVVPVLGEIAARGRALTVYSQDDPEFPATITPRIDDHELVTSDTGIRAMIDRSGVELIGFRELRELQRAG